MTFFTLLAIVALIAVYGITIYNKLVKTRQMVSEGWSGVDVQLKRRSNLIPNLLAAVKGYMSHEKDLLEEVTRMRSNAQDAENSNPEARAQAEGLLSGGLMRLFAVMENYPELKANENIAEFQESLEEIENEIQLSRRYYNGSVRNLNVAVESFPSNLVANYFKFEQAEYFEIEDPAARDVPTVEF